MKRSYKSNVPATLLTLIKVAEGALALLVLVMLVVGAVGLAQAISHEAKGAGVTLGGFFDYFMKQATDLAGVKIDPELQKALSGIGNVAIPVLIGIIVLIVMNLANYILKALDAVGSAMVRFSDRGAGLVRTVHLIYAAFKIVAILEIIAGVVAGILNLNKLTKMLDGVNPDGILVIEISVIVIAVVMIIVNIIPFFYHKDIAMNMRYVLRDSNNMKSRLRKNRLSGLSIFFGILTTIVFVFMLLGILQNGLLDTEPVQAVTALVYGGTQMLKYYLLAASNKKLKAYAVAVRKG